MAALPAALRELAEQAAFRVYLTDVLYLMGENKRLTRRWYDIVTDTAPARRAATPADADAIAQRLGIRFTTEENP